MVGAPLLRRLLQCPCPPSSPLLSPTLLTLMLMLMLMSLPVVLFLLDRSAAIHLPTRTLAMLAAIPLLPPRRRLRLAEARNGTRSQVTRLLAAGLHLILVRIRTVAHHTPLRMEDSGILTSNTSNPLLPLLHTLVRTLTHLTHTPMPNRLDPLVVSHLPSRYQ